MRVTTMNEATEKSEENELPWIEKIGLALVSLGVLSLIIATIGWGEYDAFSSFFVTLALLTTGTVIYSVAHFLKHPPGIRNDHVVTASVSARGAIGWMIGVLLTSFYILMYWFTGHDWEANTPHGLLAPLVHMFDPVSHWFRGKAADKYFMYGAMYTITILLMGFRMLLKYRHSRYQMIRTLSVMFFQLIFAFILPSILASLQEPERYLNYFWPLSYKDMFPENVNYLISHQGVSNGAIAKFLLLWTGFLTVIGTPVFTYFWGKRWYCSWVCGCGALANTLGDPWRQLSSKKLSAWRVERFTVYSVLALILFITILLWAGQFIEQLRPMGNKTKEVYGFLIGMVFAGVVGTGFYPIFGTRLWCRFGCPQAAILGIIQRFFSRFRITTNGSQCISCGNCSTYCEMGIDVRWYAQRGQNIVRASCVGCGVCSSVCPRGVLNLENGPREQRINPSFSLTDFPKAGK